jgi:hypothetical protein
VAAGLTGPLATRRARSPEEAMLALEALLSRSALLATWAPAAAAAAFLG